MSYHPQTDGALEHTNKTIIQCLHFHVEQNQKGWAKALPKVCFDILNTLNSSTGLSPCLLPPLISSSPPTDSSIKGAAVEALITEMTELTNAAQDNLLAAKINQVHAANKDWTADPAFKIGDKVLLAMAHC